MTVAIWDASLAKLVASWLALLGRRATNIVHELLTALVAQPDMAGVIIKSRLSLKCNSNNKTGNPTGTSALHGLGFPAVTKSATWIHGFVELQHLLRRDLELYRTSG